MPDVVSYITDYYAPKVGGLERSIEYLARALADRRPIEILSPGASGTPCGPGGWHAAVLRQLEARRGPIIAHLFGFSFRWPNLQIELITGLKRAGARLLLKVPTSGDAKESLNGTFRPIMPHIDRFIALTGALADELALCGVPPQCIERIPNGVPLDRFRSLDPAERRAARRKWDLPPDRLVVCFAGRFVRRKRIDLLVSALRHLPGTQRPLLVLVGYVDPEFADGTPLDDWLGPDVRWIPTQADMAALYPACDVYASASEAEGMSNAVLEAMACGIPVIATDIPGHAELVEPDRTGWLFPAGDEQGLATRLKEVVSLADAGSLWEFGERGRRRVAEGFDVRHWGERYDRLYDELAECGGRR